MRTLDTVEFVLRSASRLIVAALALTLFAAWIPPPAAAGGVGVALP
jgi:hypothetical protein